MPELPEVETTRCGILPYLQDQMIDHLVIRTPRLRWPISQMLFNLKSERIIAVNRRAKYLIIQLELGYIIVHLGMSGSLRIVSATDPVDKHDHIDLVLANGNILRYNDPRKFGAWLWTESLEQFSLFEKLGPEPLSEAFTGEYLFSISRKRHTAVKSWLMNNAVVVGVGNIYANEVLFRCKIHPMTEVAALSIVQCESLASQIKSILQQAIAQGGTTLQDFVQPDGRPGYFKQALNVYGRKNEPCVDCGAPIESLMIGQRNSFYCPICQLISANEKI
ncbi:bifunctional DNA-formamidopyrimidine glycosylase/DNA-(apurinic or apyrimidinic site) lyase [Gallibacterium trehalosifermentans]|uniref:Formamidopyrimidine-DNA glycosylase n=1 Tax=Gallibacterium trehalosifermentans TaxID=516935 RepID=A0ABV6GZN2_9PAST